MSKNSLPVPWPFSFPKHPCAPRRHGPRGYLSYRHFKDWLRDEFDFRCLYCLTRERWERDPRFAFSVEHLTPRSKRPDWETFYPNLAYACTSCNSARRDIPLPFDPRKVSIGGHLQLDATGKYVPQTKFGDTLLKLLCLNVPNLIEHRRKALYAYCKVIGKVPGATGLEFDQFRYPDVLPDLRKLHPPGGNSRVSGISKSAFVRKLRGTLPEYY